jgi:chaperonin cofactor prefoldin
MNSSIEISVESLPSSIDQIKERISEFEDNVDVLEQQDEEKGKKLKSMNRICKTSGTLVKDQTDKSQT